MTAYLIVPALITAAVVIGFFVLVYITERHIP